MVILNRSVQRCNSIFDPFEETIRKLDYTKSNNPELKFLVRNRFSLLIKNY